MIKISLFKKIFSRKKNINKITDKSFNKKYIKRGNFKVKNIIKFEKDLEKFANYSKHKYNKNITSNYNKVIENIPQDVVKKILNKDINLARKTVTYFDDIYDIEKTQKRTHSHLFTSYEKLLNYEKYYKKDYSYSKLQELRNSINQSQVNSKLYGLTYGEVENIVSSSTNKYEAQYEYFKQLQVMFNNGELYARFSSENRLDENTFNEIINEQIKNGLKKSSKNLSNFIKLENENNTEKTKNINTKKIKFTYEKNPKSVTTKFKKGFKKIVDAIANLLN